MEFILNRPEQHCEESDYVITCKIIIYNLIAMGLLALSNEIFR